MVCVILFDAVNYTNDSCWRINAVIYTDFLLNKSGDVYYFLANAIVKVAWL